MEQVSSFSFSKFPEEGMHEFFFQSEQDGLFFGLEFLKNFLKTGDGSEKPDITAYLQDGACVFKGQICLGVNLKDQIFKKEDLMSVVSYFSGAYTLISCFTEKNFDFSIMAFSSPDFALAEWEEEAILKAGGLIQQYPNNICFYPEEAHQAVEKGEKKIVLSNLKISKKELKDLLRLLPSYIECSLQGHFFPSDLEEFRAFNLKSVYPLCLQGSFPRLKMKLCERYYTPLV